MYRISKFGESAKIYGVKIVDLEDEETIEQIDALASEGNPVIICYDLEDLYVFGIDADDVVIVEKD